MGSIKGLESRIEELEAEKSKLENDLADAEAARVQERDDRIAAETEVEDLRAEKSRLEKDLDATNSKLNRLNSLVDRLNKDNGDSQKEINRLRAENAELFGDKNNLEIQMRGLREDSVPRKDYDYLKSRLSQEKTRATVAETRLAAEAQARPEKEAVDHTEPEETIDPPQIGGGRLTDAWRLLKDKQEPTYALVAAMCDVECNLRLVLDDPELDWHTSLEMALQNGYISPEQRDGLERMRERRNQILHGMVPLRLEESQARNDLAYLKQIIDQL